jgi:hypothetical protein
MSWMDWFTGIVGVICVCVGLAYFFSPRFSQYALQNTAKGSLWMTLLGERWAPIVAKFVFSIVSIAFGAWLIYNAVAGKSAF